MKRIIALIMSIFIVILCSSCNNDNENSDNQNEANNNIDSKQTEYLTLPFCANDLLNPYTAKTKENQEISTVLFDPLVFIDGNYNVEYVLATSISCDGNTCTIELNNYNCSDGKMITSEDITYSIKQIFNNKGLYYDQLKNIYSYKAVDANTVEIKLEKYDPYFINNLDFPIICQESASLKDDNDRNIPPVGYGKYTLVNDNGNYYLEANENYHKKIAGKRINLLNCPDDESLKHAISIGEIDCIYSDLSNSYLPNLSGTRFKVNLNNLVFMGINSKKDYLNNAEFRHILNCLIDRQKIVDSSYLGYAECATGLFNPNWKIANDFSTFDTTVNLEKSVAYFNQLGYNEKDNEGYYLNKKGKRFKFKLIYNSDNISRSSAASIICRTMIKNGIEIEPVGLEYKEYVKCLKSGDYDLYIGETRISQSMNISEMIENDNVFYGVSENSKFKTTFADFYSGNGDLGLAINAFNDELPFIPICYRYGLFICSNSLSDFSSLVPSANCVYNGIENTYIK